MVQPVLGPPPSINKVDIMIANPKGNNQKLQLFKRGKAISGAPIDSGICQFAKPAKIGMRAPKIMVNPCMVIKTLYVAGLTNCIPG